jgi:hypothetical protein
MGRVPAYSATAYTGTLYVIVNIVKGGGLDMQPPPSPAWANFSIMMECTPESGLLPLCEYSVLETVPFFRLFTCEGDIL